MNNPVTPQRTDAQPSSSQPLGAADALTQVREELEGIGLHVLDIQGRFSRSNDALMVYITLARPCNQRYLSAIEFTVNQTINRCRVNTQKTQVYWRYQLPIQALHPPARRA